jgi:hypothetical protein
MQVAISTFICTLLDIPAVYFMLAPDILPTSSRLIYPSTVHLRYILSEVTVEHT